MADVLRGSPPIDVIAGLVPAIQGRQTPIEMSDHRGNLSLSAHETTVIVRHSPSELSHPGPSEKVRG